VYCNAPAVGPFGQFAERVKHDPSWGYAEMPTGHDVMVTDPELLADFLLGLADAAFAGRQAPKNEDSAARTRRSGR
jgi:hypothetical protein